MSDLVVPNSLATKREGTLPAEVTTFVGRRHELNEVRQLLGRSRLVTLTGVGGVGKTRLALRLASEVRRTYADGVCLVELSSVSNVQLVPHVVAAGLGLADRSAVDVVDVLADHLVDRQLLLILDTCEHLVDACALLAEVLLRAVPGLRILATSRQPLDVAGEHTFQLAPLIAPDPTHPVGPDATVGADSIELFVDRAGAVVHGFSLTADNRCEVARLCHRLDGIPLAIELAVVWLRVMPLAVLLQRLDDRFRLLGRARTGAGRHQTLSAAIGWSHELCTERERLLWARLSAFPGDFDLASAERVCGDQDLPADQVIDVLAGLVEKSVLQCDQATGRYVMLDTIREYGLAQLGRLGERDALLARHRDCYQAFVEAAVRRWRGDGQTGLFTELRREQANLRTAFDYSLATPGQELTGLEMVTALGFYWSHSGHLSEGYDWLVRALDLCRDASEARAWALQTAAMVAGLRGDAGNARAHLVEARQIAESCRNPLLTAHVLQTSGLIEHWTEGPAQAGPDYEAAIRIYEAEGYDQPLALACLANLASVHTAAGDFERALELCALCIRLCEGRGDLWCLSFAHWMRAVVFMLSGDVEQASAALDACLRIKEDFGDLHGIAMAFDVAAGVAAQVDPERAAVLFGASDELWRFMNAPPPGPSYHAIRESYRAMAIKAIGDDRFGIAHLNGTRLSVAEVIALIRGRHGPAQALTPAKQSLLTRRERQIAELVAEGLSNRDIAERLVIAKRTADSHLEHILAKLGFTSRAQIAAWVAGRSAE